MTWWKISLGIAFLLVSTVGVYEWLDNDEPEHELGTSVVNAEPSPSPKPNFASSSEHLKHPPFECRKLYDEICYKPNKKDPTGRSALTPESEAKVLRMFEELVRAHPQETPDKIDERLVKKIYTKERTQTLHRLFTRTKQLLVKMILKLTGKNQEAGDFYRARLDKIKLELPPPATLYSDERAILTGDDALFYEVGDVPSKIRIGGALVSTIDSQFNLIQTLAHELAHALSPCSISKSNISWAFYTRALKCLGYTKEKVLIECSHPGKMNEIIADWFAAGVVAEIIHDEMNSFNYDEKRAAIKNSVRDLCDYGTDTTPDPKHDWSKAHPSGIERINGIFAQNPRIQSTLQCLPRPQQQNFRIPGECFKWIELE
ncbi:MAG: hypothetical protein KA715_09825 [Xanthomonadaceae bacterium]|nr:hypothetical protein [Xanthomonadaceae bacterium]